MDLRQSNKYGKYLEEGLGWDVVTVKDNSLSLSIFIKRLGIFGAIAKIQRVEWPIDWDEVDKVLKENRVWMCKLEPNVEIPNTKYEVPKIIHDLGSHGFKQDRWPLCASKTISLSLSTSLREIEKQMKKDARYTLRKILNSNIEISNNFEIRKNEFDEFYKCWREGSKLKKLWIPSKEKFMKMVKIFGDDCFCITVTGTDPVKVVAGVFVLIADKCAYYYYSTSLPEGKKVNAPYLLIWEAIKEAKKRGCKKWDFEGIYDDRWPDKGWLGFSHFKKSFGGKEILYIGSFVKWRLPI